ncbi:UDP-3-O-(3-hydroxymyristoyl)glucosamine N-acyltransferase [Isoalcanivorax beigongshangi]|uniref:UDP-3-O-acylglucosamine N-acyltransferase n=1 Tax=Isoalcanivorax beigongshangi TaxID=3238810 RepID=A0ABV4AGC5_9GAMM
MQTLTLAALAEALGATLRGPGDTVITGLGTLKAATGEQLAFLANPRYRSQLAETTAGAVLCTAADAEHAPGAVLVVDDPYQAFARASHWFDRAPRPAAGIHPRAVVSELAQVHPSASIGANAVIEDGVTIGADVVIMPGCFIGAGSSLAEGVRLWPNVTIYHGVKIGPGTIIHAGSVVGADGFGFAFSAGQWHKVAQVGGVSIGAGVEIGANVTIDRGAIDDTLIGDGVILDDQVHLGHNVVVGDHTAMAGKVGVSGSTRIGRHCLLGGAVGVAGHLDIADGVTVLGMTLVSRSLTERGVYGSALPADRQDRWQRNAARFRHLDELYRRVRTLEKGRRDGD